MQTKLGKKFWISMLIFGLMGQVAWVVENMYFNVFIYKMFHASAADISAMVMASAVTAAVTTIIMGAVSDKVGKRKAFMSVGYIIWGVSIISFAYIKSVMLTIVMDCVMTYFGSTANDAAYNAWLTDRGDETNRGKIEGVNSMMPLVAILIVFGGFMSFNLDTHEAWVSIYYIIGIATTLIGVAGWFIIEEAPGLEKSKASFVETLIYSFRPSVAKANKELYLGLLNFAIFGISIQVFMPYLIIYYEQTLGMSNYVLIMAPAIIVAAIVTVFYGRLYDSKGFMASIIPTALMLMAGYAILYFTTTTIPVFIGSMLMMSGYLCGMSIFGAMIRDSIPENRAGQFQGVRIIGQVFVPGLIGPAIGAWVLRDAELITNGDGTTSFLPNIGIWSAAFVVVIVLLITLRLTMRKDNAMRRAQLCDIYAHRGYHDKPQIPENSIIAFKRAIEHGFPVELDVHLIADGSLVVFHDDTLDRITGVNGRIADYDLDNLSELRLEGSDEQIPTFNEVLKLFENTRRPDGTISPLLIELKVDKGNYKKLVPAVLERLDRYTGPFVIESFDPRAMLLVKKLRPNIVRGQLARDFYKEPHYVKKSQVRMATNMWYNIAVKPDFIAYKFSDRDNKALRRAVDKHGVAEAGWTIKKPEQYQAARRSNVCAIFEQFDPNEVEI